MNLAKCLKIYTFSTDVQQCKKQHPGKSAKKMSRYIQNFAMQMLGVEGQKPGVRNRRKKYGRKLGGVNILDFYIILQYTLYMLQLEYISKGEEKLWQMKTLVKRYPST